MMLGIFIPKKLQRFWKINNMDIKYVGHDGCGNPRYAIHFLNFLTPQEKEIMGKEIGKDFVTKWYNIAVKRANKYGGKKYNFKKFGGGIVFQAYSEKEVENIANKAVLESFLPAKRVCVSHHDIHLGFVGITERIRDEKYIVVIDGEGDAWDCEPEELEILE